MSALDILNQALASLQGELGMHNEFLERAHRSVAENEKKIIEVKAQIEELELTIKHLAPSE